MAEKVQLGARVPAEVRERALEEAKRRGVSLNVYVERSLGLMLEESPECKVRLDRLEQPLVDIPDEREERAQEARELLAAAQEISRPARPPEPSSLPVFSPDCRNATLHWRNGPERPCRFCGGTRYE
jgi:hypothetical protein